MQSPARPGIFYNFHLTKASYVFKGEDSTYFLPSMVCGATTVCAVSGETKRQRGVGEAKVFGGEGGLAQEEGRP